MPDISLMPLSGMNTEAEDAGLHKEGDSPRHFLRDAVNMDLTAEGKAEVRPGVRQVTSQPICGLWQSPLHGDTFATLDGQWVLIDTDSWDTDPLTYIGKGESYHEVVNNLVVVAGTEGIFTFNGAKAERLTVDTPPSPFANALKSVSGVTTSDGSFDYEKGKVGFAIAWMREDKESALSEVAFTGAMDTSSFEVSFPMALDSTITGVRLYMTSLDGGELRKQGDYPIGTPAATVSQSSSRGGAAQFRHLSPMPTGKYLKYWRGRLVTAKANVLRFSEALAYHLHDERHGFILMPQRITFVLPVSGGIWVGQADHVAFLQGSALNELSVVRKAAKPPLPGSAILADADALGGELGGGGAGAAVWLAENGYVAGTADGQLVELQKGVMGGVTGSQGTSVVLERRMLTAVT